MEAREVRRKAKRREINKVRGQSLDKNDYGMGSYSPQIQAQVVSLPAYPYDATQPLQDPATGKFYYMAGVGVLGVDPIASGG